MPLHLFLPHVRSDDELAALHVLAQCVARVSTRHRYGRFDAIVGRVKTLLDDRGRRFYERHQPAWPPGPDLARKVKTLARKVSDLVRKVESLGRKVPDLVREVKSLGSKVLGPIRKVETLDGKVNSPKRRALTLAGKVPDLALRALDLEFRALDLARKVQSLAPGLFFAGFRRSIAAAGHFRLGRAPQPPKRAKNDLALRIFDLARKVPDRVRKALNLAR